MNINLEIVADELSDLHSVSYTKDTLLLHNTSTALNGSILWCHPKTM